MKDLVRVQTLKLDAARTGWPLHLSGAGFAIRRTSAPYVSIGVQLDQGERVIDLYAGDGFEGDGFSTIYITNEAKADHWVEVVWWGVATQKDPVIARPIKLPNADAGHVYAKDVRTDWTGSEIGGIIAETTVLTAAWPATIEAVSLSGAAGGFVYLRLRNAAGTLLHETKSYGGQAGYDLDHWVGMRVEAGDYLTLERTSTGTCSYNFGIREII